MTERLTRHHVTEDAKSQVMSRKVKSSQVKSKRGTTCYGPDVCPGDGNVSKLFHGNVTEGRLGVSDMSQTGGTLTNDTRKLVLKPTL